MAVFKETGYRAVLSPDSPWEPKPVTHLLGSQVQGQVDFRLPANVPLVRLVLPSSLLTSILDTHTPLDSPCTPDSFDLPLPIAIPRRRIYSTSGGGIPLSLARRGLAPGTRETLVMVPGNLQQAKEMMSKFPPAPPGRTIDDPAVKSKRQCHGCHGYLDHYHSAIPSGCLGGIIGGTDSKGRCWRPCPPGYNYQPTGIDYIEGDDNSEDDSDDIEDDDYLKESNNEVFKSPPGNLLGPEVSQAVTTSSSCTAGSTVVSGAGSLSSHCYIRSLNHSESTLSPRPSIFKYNLWCSQSPSGFASSTDRGTWMVQFTQVF